MQFIRALQLRCVDSRKFISSKRSKMEITPTLILTVLVCIALFMCLMLWYTSYNLAAYEDTSPRVVIDASSNKSIPDVLTNTSPRVYEFIYVRRDTDDASIWMLTRDKANIAFVNDLQNRTINHVLAGGRLYEASFIDSSSESYRVRMTDKCDSSVTMMNGCSSSPLVSTQPSLVVHCLGFKL